MKKTYISSSQLLRDSYSLGLQVFESGFQPDVLIALWRGGSSVGIAIQELLALAGNPTIHFSITAASYTGIHQRAEVKLSGLESLYEQVNSKSRVLFVDDVFDTGKTMQKVMTEISDHYGNDIPECRIATPYFKPENNLTDLTPDYYLYEEDQWLVFPHELIGLERIDIEFNKPDIDGLRLQLAALLEKSEI